MFESDGKISCDVCSKHMLKPDGSAALLWMDPYMSPEGWTREKKVPATNAGVYAFLDYCEECSKSRRESDPDGPQPLTVGALKQQLEGYNDDTEVKVSQRPKETPEVPILRNIVHVSQHQHKPLDQEDPFALVLWPE